MAGGKEWRRSQELAARVDGEKYSGVGQEGFANEFSKNIKPHVGFSRLATN